MKLLNRLLKYLFLKFGGIATLIVTIIAILICIKKNKEAKDKITDLKRAGNRLIILIIIFGISLAGSAMMTISLVRLDKMTDVYVDKGLFYYLNSKKEGAEKQSYGSQAEYRKAEFKELISYIEKNKNKPEKLPIIIVLDKKYKNKEATVESKVKLLKDPTNQEAEIVIIPEKDKKSGQKSYIEKVKNIYPEFEKAKIVNHLYSIKDNDDKRPLKGKQNMIEVIGNY